jgi:hypothetical protein
MIGHKSRDEFRFKVMSKNQKNNFWLALFFRKIGLKMTFDFGGPGNPAERTF